MIFNGQTIATILLAPLLLTASVSGAGSGRPRSYACPFSAEAPKIDGQLNDAAWRKAPWSADFVDIEGDAKEKPALRTRVKMLWDDRCLYIAAELEEPHVWATLTERDSVIFHDPDFEVFIDPDGDTRDYCEFEINALNTGWDLLLDKPYREGGQARNEWDIAGLRTAVHVDGTLNDPRDRDRGWSVELALPWAALSGPARRRAPPADGDEWRVNFSRVEWAVEVADGAYRKIPGRPESNWVWSPQGLVDMHQPERWGRVHFRRGSAAPAAAQAAPAGVAAEPETETDPLVLRKLEWFCDQKFGLLLHWGPYSQWGIVESWSICSEDEPWCQRSLRDYAEYVRRYEELKTTFNPVGFDPAAWAAAARAAGMRYVVFTTKHHDGFCMFDTRQTDYRITDPGCPFHGDVNADVTRALFAACRRQGLGTGAYFSKPDWHHPAYWDRYWAHPDRNVNYDVVRYPEKWACFSDFTFRQIEELVSGYGPLDILWLDGGWVNPGNRGQDIGMPRIAAMARRHQPGLIVVDRAVGGRYENYRTPEQQVPEKPLAGPWETCMTMATSWSFKPGDVYKPVGELIRLLADVVAKGGNLLLNVGPAPDGTLPAAALERLAEIGAWMAVNGSAIYATRPVAPWTEGDLRFTRGPDGAVHVICPAGADREAMPARIPVRSFRAAPGSRVTLLGDGRPLPWNGQGEGLVVSIPAPLRRHPPCRHAWVLRIEKPLPPVLE